MKILLVAPCQKSEQRHSTMNIPQLTLSLIAAMTPPKYEIEICEEVFGEIINFEGNYDIIGITLMTQTCIRGYEIANEFKKRGKIVVFGGIHATSLPEEAIMFGDAVVIGEAEDGLWERVLTDIEENKLQSFYKLDKLPCLQKHVFPRRDLIKCSSGKFSIAPIETTRGCPYNCDFCTVSRFFGTKQRHKPIEDIIRDVKSCKQNNLFFLDDNITGDKVFAKKLFEALIPLKKTWVGQASINISKDEELMRLAKESGCLALLIGFESMTDDGLNHYRKTLKTIEENVIAVKKLKDYGIMTMASLIFGLDSDTIDNFDLGYKFLTKANPAFFQACVMTPYPGTPVFNKLKSEGRILTDDWSKFDATKVLISPKNMTPEELYEGYNKIKKSIYSNKSILKRSLSHLSLGLKKSLLFFTLNKGYQYRHEDSLKNNIIRNKENDLVDFDVTKYVVPYMKKQAIKLNDSCLCEIES
ncbi:MAG: hypothetical protein A2X02_08115 [Bacteroidetes bacterium GWF2_29_10]|nr:MAG: hypothetical protein A2X02_08115 [Bacteroidetes bacterium GWF2_29_10]